MLMQPCVELRTSSSSSRPVVGAHLQRIVQKVTGTDGHDERGQLGARPNGLLVKKWIRQDDQRERNLAVGSRVGGKESIRPAAAVGRHEAVRPCSTQAAGSSCQPAGVRVCPLPPIVCSCCPLHMLPTAAPQDTARGAASTVTNLLPIAAPAGCCAQSTRGGGTSVLLRWPFWPAAPRALGCPPAGA